MNETTKEAGAGNMPSASNVLSGVPLSEVAAGTVHDPSTVWQSPTQGPGLYMTADHRYWWNGKGPVPSVTTILRVLDKPAVTQWVARVTAEAAMAHLPELIGKGVDDGVKFLLSLPREKTDTAAKLGTYVHLLSDMVARGDRTAPLPFEVADEAIPYLDAFRGFLAFLEARGGSIISSEKAVFNLTDGWAGTYDLLYRLDGELWLGDIKTSRGYYPEYGLQLAAYSRAEFIALEGDPTRYPMPKVDRVAVIHLRPDTYPDTGWRMVEYPVTDRDYMAFLAAIDIWQWKGEGRFTKSILQKAIAKGELHGIRPDPLTTESGG